LSCGTWELRRGYPRLVVAMVLFFGMIYWLSRRGRRKANSNRV